MPYRKGYNTDFLTKKLNALVSDKGLRSQTVDHGALKETKGRENWVAYLLMESSEVLAVEMDAAASMVVDRQADGFHRLMERAAKLERAGKDTEYHIKQALTQHQAEVLKGVKDLGLKVVQLKADLDALSKSQKILNKGLSSEIKALNTSVVTIIQEGNKDAATTLQGMLTQVSRGIEGHLGETRNALLGEVQASAGSLSKQSTEQIKGVTDRLDALTERVDTVTERIDGHQESLINILDDNQTALAEEIQQGFGLLDQNNMARAESLAAKLMEIEGKIDQIGEDFNARIGKLEESVRTAMEEKEAAMRKYLEKEVAGLRDLLATIRSDIELQKRVILDMKR